MGAPNRREGRLKIALGQKWKPVITNYGHCFGSIPEHEESISPVRFHGQLLHTFLPCYVLASFVFMMLNVFSFQEK